MSASFTFGRVSSDATVASVHIHEPAEWILVVRVIGELDIATVPQLRTVLRRHLEWLQPCRLVLDLAGVTLLSSAALTLLLELHHHTRDHDQHLILAGAGHRAVHPPLRTSGLLALFDTRPSTEQALVGAAAYPAAGGHLRGATDPAHSPTRRGNRDENGMTDLDDQTSPDPPQITGSSL